MQQLFDFFAKDLAVTARLSHLEIDILRRLLLAQGVAPVGSSIFYRA